MEPSLMRIARAHLLLLTGLIVAVVLSLWTIGATARGGEQVSRRQEEPVGIWRHIGPIPILPGDGQKTPSRYNSGRVIAIAANPRNPNHWLAGAGTGGLWTTNDAGQTWTSNTDSLPSLAIGAIAFAPSNAAVVYAGTGEAKFSRDARAGVGLLKSLDGGVTWITLANEVFNQSAVAAIRVHPTNAEVVLAATARAPGNGRFSEVVLGARPPFGVLRSTDGGATWTRTLPGQATAIEIDPNNFNNQYGVIDDVGAGQNNDSPGSRPNGLYRSTDGGQNWSEIAGPWTRAGRIVPAIAPSNANVMYVSISGLRADGEAADRVVGLFRTDNAWATTPSWVQISTEATGPQGYCSIQCGEAHVVTVDPTDPETIFAGGRDFLWRCRNCGSSPVWKSSAGAIHPDHRALAWAGNRLLDGNDGGVASSIDRGETWQIHNATLAITQIFSGALHPTKPRMVLINTRDHGCMTPSEGTSWTIARGHKHGVCEGDVAISSSHPDTDWMAAADFGEISRTHDGGQSFALVVGGIGEPVARFTAAVRKCPANDDVFLTGNTRLWRTNDFFSAANATWTANGPSNAGEVRGIAFAEADRSCNTYAFGIRSYGDGGTDGTIWLTTNGGNSWTNITSGARFPGRTVASLTFDPRDSNILYAALGNFAAFATGTPGRAGHVFKSTNALSASPSWIDVSPPEDQPANVIVMDPKNPSTVYLGSDLGVWKSSDGATTWRHMGPEVGMPNVPVSDLKIHPMTSEVFAFTYGRGVFALTPQ